MSSLGNKIGAYKAEKADMQAKLEKLREEMATVSHQMSLVDAKIEALEEVFAEEAAAQIEEDFWGEKPFVGLREAMREVLKTWTGPFTRPQMAEAIRAAYPGIEFSERGIEGPITELMEESLIERIVRGNAKRPSVYLVKQQEEAAA